MTALADAGWIAPADPGPTGRRVAVLLGLAIACLLVWVLVPTGRVADALDDGGAATLSLRVAGDGAVMSADAGRTRLRTSGGARFAVTRVRLRRAGSPLIIRVAAADGVDRRAVVLRAVVPGARVRLDRARDGSPRAMVDPARGHDAYLLVTVPVRALPTPPTDRAAGKLQSLTGPIDDQIAAIRDDRERLDRLREGWWWLPLLGLVAPAATLLLWRRACRQFLSMREPGPGTETTVTPPSSLDPVGAAAIVAGARPIDVGHAFAGYVLDLVERRQLRMRRTLDPVYGAGALLGLAQVDDADIRLVEDPGVLLLRTVAVDEGSTVALPDAPSRRALAPTQTRRDWAAHVAARARFERLLELGDWRRVAAAAAVLGAVAIGGIAVGILADGVGRRTTGWLVAAIAVPWFAADAAWALDARRWRRVVRTRRLERAQWLAWGGGGDGHDGPGSDLRNLPLLVAIGRDVPHTGVVPPEAVALRAATPASVAALVALVDPRAQ